MKKKITLSLVIAITAVILFSFKDNNDPGAYPVFYKQRMDHFRKRLNSLVRTIQEADMQTPEGIAQISNRITEARAALKETDFWSRYLEPISYKRINGPLPVEWETEVFEKFEKPYKREGAGLTLAALYLEESHIYKDTLLSIVQASANAMNVYDADSITRELNTYHHFFLCNRLFLLNLAAIYTTGFECPDTAQIIPELRAMLGSTGNIYSAFNESFPATPLTEEYLSLYKKAVAFADAQPAAYSSFDHFTFIRDYVNPLFAQNQQFIRQYRVVTHSLVDYSLNKTATSIFKKSLYNGQNPKGIFLRVKDSAVLAEMDRLGKLLFYDPILSGNNERSCASCHKPGAFLTDTIAATPIQFNRTEALARNTPSLVNAAYNHLIMLDGKHISLQDQSKAVICNPAEMGGNELETLKKIMSCKTYNAAFKKLLAYTPQETEVTFAHIASVLTYYYCKFSDYYAPFDEAMNDGQPLSDEARAGFNVFMGKAQCGTCHFVPQFNGVKPPYVGSEFEVLGVPQDTGYRVLDKDNGRYGINPAQETAHAFRTGTIRNAARTMPYMHNGVFRSLNEVIDFYDHGGGAGRGLAVANQTLSADSLNLSSGDKRNLIAFIHSLTENVLFEAPPEKLPASKIKALNKRIPGGSY